MRRATLAALLVLPLAACGGASNTPNTPTSADATHLFTGQTVNVVTGAPAGNLVVSAGTGNPVTADSSGNFTIDLGGSGTYRMDVRGGGFVARETSISAAPDRVPVSMIPGSFDLFAFDEMFRTENARLQRWTTRPALVVVATTMVFQSTGQNEFQASSEQMSDDDVNQLVAHLSEGLTLMTANTFTSWASVEVERPNAGDRVFVTRTGKVVVGRYSGIATNANTIGYGRWSETSDGTVVGGAMFLDRDFDRNDPRRRLLRIHELGHALGYQHVKSRTSIMNPAIGPEPTEFDRTGAVIAFQRPPGNRSPDTDPVGVGVHTALSTDSGGRWSSVICHFGTR
jgi:hypothetical protein